MAEYIEREAAIKCCTFGRTSLGLVGELRRLPAADVRPVVLGRWVDEPIKGIRYHCSVCQGRFDYTWHFCPNCGADMREES